MQTHQHLPIFICKTEKRFPKVTSSKKTQYALYKCFCGKEFESSFSNCSRGIVKSCGCLNHVGTHGMTHHKLYGVLDAMKQRCTNHNNKFFPQYGGRGISICSEWANDYGAFISWALVNGYEDGLTIDRINNDGNYEPSNCRFVSRFIQQRNTRLVQSNNKSGYRGVSKPSKSRRWIAQITVNRKNIVIGRFDTPLEASIAYDNYVIENNLEHNINKSK